MDALFGQRLPSSYSSSSNESSIETKEEDDPISESRQGSSIGMSEKGVIDMVFPAGIGILIRTVPQLIGIQDIPTLFNKFQEMLESELQIELSKVRNEIGLIWLRSAIEVLNKDAIGETNIRTQMACTNLISARLAFINAAENTPKQRKIPLIPIKSVKRSTNLGLATTVSVLIGYCFKNLHQQAEANEHFDQALFDFDKYAQARRDEEGRSSETEVNSERVNLQNELIKYR